MQHGCWGRLEWETKSDKDLLYARSSECFISCISPKKMYSLFYKRGNHGTDAQKHTTS